MFHRENGSNCPTLAEMSAYISNPLWDDLCGYMKETYRAVPVFEFSRCSWEFGWNAKFKKGKRSLCTVYPRENHFAIMIVIGKKEKVPFEEALPSFCPEIRQTYEETKEGCGQKWLMTELEDQDRKYEDVKNILRIRAALG